MYITTEACQAVANCLANMISKQLDSKRTVNSILYAELCTCHNHINQIVSRLCNKQLQNNL